MSSKQTDSSQEKKQILNDWMPESVGSKSKLAKPVDSELGAEFKKMLDNGIIDGISPKHNMTKENESSIGTDDISQLKDRNDTMDSLQTESLESANAARSTIPKRVSGKQRKESLEEYRETFLQVPKLDDRKPVFISREVRDRIDEIVHRLGGRGRSVSGFIENLARHHLETYQDDVEAWKKL